MDRKIPCVIMRGGTSKGVFFAAADLPTDPKERDRAILSAFGSPDVRQIDGLGGADPLTSKLAIVVPSSRSDADVDFTFGQVGIDSAAINYDLNCGNLSSAVGPYAIDEGLVRAESPFTRIRIFNTNTRKLITGEIPVQDGRAQTSGDLRIAGVPGFGAEIRLSFHEPTGAITGMLLPTGSAQDEISLEDGQRIAVSVVDCGNLYVFLAAGAFSLNGAETPGELEAKPGFLSTIESIREGVVHYLLARGKFELAVAQRLKKGLKVALIARPTGYTTLAGDAVSAQSVDVVARIVNPGRVHKAYAVTGAMCLAAAAAIDKSIVCEVLEEQRHGDFVLRIGHPQGVIDPVAETTREPLGPVIQRIQIKRTARRLMEGFVYIRTS